MSYRQLRKPNPAVKEYAGSCLKMSRLVFNVPSRYYTAWEAWDATKHFSRSRTLPKDVAVLVWFDWTGHVPGLGTRRWGHVGVNFPGRGVLSSPLSGYGQRWFSSIAALENEMTRATGTKVTYVGWSLDINGYMVAEKVPGKPSGSTPTSTKGTKVKHHYQRRDKTANGKKNAKRTVKPGGGLYLNEKNTNVSNATNIVGGIGDYHIVTHVYVQGTPGDVLDVKLIWQDTNAKPPSSSNSAHYIEQVVIGPNGFGRRNFSSIRKVARGYAVYVRAEAPTSNKGNVDITLLASDAHLYA